MKCGVLKLSVKKQEVQYEDIDLWEGLDPKTSMADRLILYAVARQRYPGTEEDANFSETEDSDDDTDGPGTRLFRCQVS